MKSVFKEVMRRIATAFFIWFGLAGMYGAGGSSPKSSPLYNTETDEIWVGFVLIPIIAIAASIILGVIRGLGRLRSN
jgi:hypothetical protein